MLAVLLGTGCDGVFGEVESVGVTTFRVASGDAGEGPSGLVVVDPRNGGGPYTFEVTCLRVAGKLAFVGADQDPGNGFAGYVEIAIEDAPGPRGDRVAPFISTRGTADCAEEPRSLPDENRVGGDVQVFDDLRPGSGQSP